MKLKNKAYVTNMANLLEGIQVGIGVNLLLAFTFFFLTVSVSSAHNKPTKDHKEKVTGDVFRILQNGEPVIPIMGVAVNSEGIFQIQVRRGIELKKIKEKPIEVEIAIVRGEKKIGSKKFSDINSLQLQNLRSWLESNFQEGDKFSIELFNTVLDSDQAIKTYSLARVY